MSMTNRLRPLWPFLVGGCAAVIAVAPTAHADVDRWHLPERTGTSSDGASPYDGAPTVVSGGPVPTMNGVPCVAGHLGTCIGFAQNSPPRKTPRSTVGHSPTVSP